MPAIAKYVTYNPVDLWIQSGHESTNNSPRKTIHAQHMVAHEFHSQMSIQNENILIGYDHFRQQINGENWLVIISEKCDIPLNELKPFSKTAVFDIFMQVASGLTAIVKKKMIHRDIKPENILLKEIGSRWVARISDFGLANRHCIHN